MISSPRKLLILDLDETLIHATDSPLAYPAEFYADPFYVYKRPGLTASLAYCLQHFDVAVRTSSSADYAVDIVDGTFPDPAALQFVWAYERCHHCYDDDLRKHYTQKPISKVRRRHRTWPLHQILAVDNTPRKWEKSWRNLIPVSDWEGDQSDTELAALTTYLETLREVPDVRSVDKRNWRAQMENNLIA